MPIELETIPPNAIKLITANVGVDMFGIFGDRNKEMIETLYRTDDNRYLIDYGLEIIIEQPTEDVLEWLEHVECLEDDYYQCYNNTKVQVLLAELKS